jgi:hypothetical protein
MSKVSTWLLFVVAAALAIGASFLGERKSSVGSATADESPRTREVQKWEYKVVEFGYGYKDFKAREKNFTASLNKLGKEGWEYAGPLTQETIVETKVTGFPSSAGSRSFVVFKRPRK